MNPSFFLKEEFGDLRKRLLFVVLMIIVYRIGVHIPIPLVDINKITTSFDSDNIGIFSLFNLFSGGALSKVSIFSLGIMPYISSSIIIQLLSTIWDPLLQLSKEGNIGKKKISQYTRYLTVLLSFFQAIGMAKFILNATDSNFNLLLCYTTVIVTLVSGTMFLMWIGEQITENGVGNGISLLIFTSIVSSIPRIIVSTLEKARQGEIYIFSLFVMLFIFGIVIFFVVYMEGSQRRITINYARRQQGGKMYAPHVTYLPLKINISGVIPPIFASSLVLFPTTLIQWFDNKSNLLNSIKILLLPGKPLYLFLFGLSIVFFSFFYTSLIFNHKDTADNLKKSGGFITGIRPGENTAFYIKNITFRLTIIGSIYLVLVSLLPEFLVLFTNVPFYFGGTSLLIVVVVVIDFISQIQTRLISYKYDSLIKRSKFNFF